MLVALSRAGAKIGQLHGITANAPCVLACGPRLRDFPVFPRLALAADVALRILTIWVSAAPGAFPVHPRQIADGQGGLKMSHGKSLLESLLIAMLV